MLTKEDFTALLDIKKVLIIDGALATELETRGHDLNHPLWSAKLLEHDPGSIEAVHHDYFIAGADVAITASYQATTQGLKRHFGLSEIDGRALIRKSVQLAQSARTRAAADGLSDGRGLLVAGSVGPLGAYLANGSEYRGDYSRTCEEFQDFHRPRLQALIEAGCDLLALETMPNLQEIRALLELIQSEFPTAIAWVSCTSRDTKHLSDGTPWSQVVNAIEAHSDQVVAIGVNCIAFASATETLKQIRKHTQMPLVCYPNSGESFDAETKTWSAAHPNDKSSSRNDERVEHAVLSTEPGSSTTSALSEWTSHGARLVGGCCRTDPAFIKSVHSWRINNGG